MSSDFSINNITKFQMKNQIMNPKNLNNNIIGSQINPGIKKFKISKISSNKNSERENETNKYNSRYETADSERNSREEQTLPGKISKTDSKIEFFSPSFDKKPQFSRLSEVDFSKSKFYSTPTLTKVSNNRFALQELKEKEIPINKKTKEECVKEKNEELINDENAVKRLDLWELKNIKQDKTSILSQEIEDRYRMSKQRITITTLAANYVDNNPNSEIAKIHEFQTLNQKKKIREGLSKVNNSKIFSPIVKDLYKKIDQEQSAILLQNINLTKRCFNFDEMNKKKHHNHQAQFQEENADKFVENKLVQIGNQVALRRKEDPNQEIFEEKDPLEHVNVKVDDPFLRCHNLKLEGNYDLLTSTDYYRRTVSEKLRIETIFRKEMMRLSRLIYLKRLEKKNLIKKNSEWIHIVSQKREKYLSKQEILEMKKKEYESNKIQQRKKNRNFTLEITTASKIGIFNKKDSISDCLNIHYDHPQIFDLDAKYSQKINFLKKEVDDLKFDYEETYNKLQKLSKMNYANLKKLDEELKQNKSVLTNLMKEQANYYLGLLKKGIDVRGEGLCWIIRRLLELNTYFDNHSFPKFIEPYQIDYIIAISKKQIDSIQLKIILKIMKNKQTKLRSERDIFRLSGMTSQVGASDYNKSKNKESMVMSELKNSKPKAEYYNDIYHEKISSDNLKNGSDGFYTRSLSLKVMKIIEGFKKKNDTMMKISYEKQLEDIQINNIVETLKKKLKNEPNNEDEIMFSNFVDLPAINTNEESDSSKINSSRSNQSNKKLSSNSINPVLEYFVENIEEKELFDDILIVRENLKKLEEEIAEMIQLQKKNFCSKYDSFKRGNTRQAIHYDLMYAALFGNHVVL